MILTIVSVCYNSTGCRYSIAGIVGWRIHDGTKKGPRIVAGIVCALAARTAPGRGLPPALPLSRARYTAPQLAGRTIGSDETQESRELTLLIGRIT